jgi:MFS family permease
LHEAGAGAPEQARTAPTGSFAALANKSFRSFTVAGMLWLMADNIEHVISYWVVFEKFDSPLLGGYAVISHWAPYLFLGAFMGAVADRYDCRKLFLVSMALFMLVSVTWGVLFWTGTVAVWHSVLLLTMHGLAGVMFTPASQLMIHDIVDEDQVVSAVRLTATSRQLSLIFGSAIGGLMLLALGPALGITLNALIYLPMVWWSLREPYTGHSRDGLARPPAPLSAGLSTVLAALRDARRSRTIVAMLLLAGLTSFLVGNAFQAQMPEFAKGYIGDDGGVLYTALLLSTGVGAIAGGLLQESLPFFRPTPAKATAIAALWALSIVAFAAAPDYLLALAILFVSGALSIGFVSMAQSLVQLDALPETRGRTIGLFNMSLNGLRIGSGFTVGVMGAVIGVHWSLAISAVVLLFCLGLMLVYLTNPAAAHGETRA